MPVIKKQRVTLSLEDPDSLKPYLPISETNIIHFIWPIIII